MASDATNNQTPAGIPVAAWRYRTNNTHTHLIAIEPPDDAYDAGTLAPLVLLADAQAALAAQAVEIEELRKDAERYRFLRNTGIDDLNDCQFFIGVDSIEHCGRWAFIGDEADEAIDAAIAKDQS